MGFHLQPTTAPARESLPAPVDNSGETAKTEVPEFFTVNSGRRFYSPELGRWLSRDPIEEEGGANLYQVVNNNCVEYIDYLGFAEAGQRVIPECECTDSNINLTMKGAKEEIARQKPPALPPGHMALEGMEYCGRICCNTKTRQAYITGPVSGFYAEKNFDPRRGLTYLTNSQCDPRTAGKCKDGDKEVGHYHSHPKNKGAGFSQDDKGWCRWAGGCKPHFLIAFDDDSVKRMDMVYAQDGNVRAEISVVSLQDGSTRKVEP